MNKKARGQRRIKIKTKCQVKENESQLATTKNKQIVIACDSIKGEFFVSNS